MPKLCAFGCAPSDVPMHRFPNADKYPERFKAWVTLVSGKLETESDYEYYQKKLICDIHFTALDRVRNKRLSALAVPSLYLHRGQSAGEPDAGLVSHPSTSDASNSGQSAGEPDAGLVSQPSTSEASNSGQSASFMLHHGTPVIEAISGSRHISSRHPNTGPTLQEPALIQADNEFSHTSSCATSTGIVQRSVSNLMKEHNYSVASRFTRKRLEKGVKGSLTYCCSQMKPFSTKIKHLQSEISRLRKRGKSFKARLENAVILSKNTAFQHVIKHMTKPAQLFLHMQLQSFKKAKGRRFTLEEKILSLSMYKKSPKAYSLLYKYFTLPSAKAMKRLLSQIKLCPGINPILFEKIKETVAEKDTPDRLCSLIFDEMSLTPQIFYNKSKDKFEGFATTQSHKFADHALVFMVKGLKHNFKQPVAYYFTSGLQKTELKSLLISVITEVQKTGLIIINTVCDQNAVNVSAMTELVNETRAKFMRLNKEWRHDLFRVNGQDIIPLYDVPHLIKGIRNNLLNKDLIYKTNNENKVVKWEYYQQVYAADKAFGELRLLNKITEEHVVPEKINKMRVKHATQIFSHSVAVVTDHLVARGQIPPECKNLIEITLLLDNLFDSLNGNTLGIPNGKIYKGPVRKSSPHHQLWKKAKQILATVKFIKKSSTGNKIRLVETTVPSVTNLIKTINGMEAICKVLFVKYGYDAVLTRNFNQDPVENFFGNIRSYGVRNISPNTISFEGAFKALLLNNYNLPHSKGANCEEDVNECLQGLHFFLNKDHSASDIPNDDNIIMVNDNLLIDFSIERNDAGQKNYVCGWVLTKCFNKIIKSCKTCRNNLMDTDNTNAGNNSFIKAKEYSNKKWLCYPNEAIQNCFNDIQNITHSFLKKDVPKVNLKNSIKSVADVLTDQPNNCSIHKEKFKEYFIDLTISVLLYSWCRTINRILSGKITYTENVDETKIAAQKHYNKYKHYKNKK